MEQDHAIASDSGQIPAESDLGPGSLVDGRYRLASVAARTPNDVVFNGLDERSRVRIRVRVTAYPSDPVLSALDHPTFAKVVDSGRSGRFHFVVLEWFDGEPVDLPPVGITNDVAQLRDWAVAAMELLDGLEHLHQNAGRAHGDFGLHSLWQASDGQLRILDLSAPDGPLIPEAVPYASPERLRGTPREPTSDLYSLAAVLYGLAYGTPPYGADPVHARSGHLLRMAADSPAGVAPLPGPFLTALRVAMDKQPYHRFGTAALMRGAFAEAMRDLDDPCNRTTETNPIRIRVPVDDVLSETLRIRRAKTTLPPLPALPALPPLPRGVVGRLDDVDQPTADTEVDRERPPGLDDPDEEPSFGTIDTTPLANNPAAPRPAPPDPGPSGALLVMFAATGVAIGVAALAVTAMLGGLAFWVALPDAPPVGQPLPPISPSAIQTTATPTPPARPPSPRPPTPTVAPAPPPHPLVVPIGFTSAYSRARPANGFDEFVAELVLWPGTVRLVGHTDSRGTPDANLDVGLGRAEAARTLLVAHGVAEEKVEVATKGEAEPVGDNRTAAGRAANRRVVAEFVDPVPGER